MSNYKYYPVEYRSLFSEKAEQHNRLLYCSNFVGGTMSYMKLIKLLYIVRQASPHSMGTQSRTTAMCL